MSETIEKRLSDLEIKLPEPAKAVANYIPFVRDGHNLYISGQLPLVDGKLIFEGQLGDRITVEQGAQAARLCAINILAQAKSAVQDLEKIDRILKLTGFVNCLGSFADHPKVINGASDLMVQIFGDRGRHARSAVGCSSLPLGASVEVEAIIRITE